MSFGSCSGGRIVIVVACITCLLTIYSVRNQLRFASFKSLMVAPTPHENDCLPQPQAPPAFVGGSCSLVNNWSDRPLHTEYARRLHNLQQQAAEGYRWHNNNWGMGSDLHTLTEAFCHSLMTNKSLWATTKWIWSDKKFCQCQGQNADMGCYFGAKMSRPNHHTRIVGSLNYGDVANQRLCVPIHKSVGTSSYRAQAMEFLFTNVSRGLIDRARGVFNEMRRSSGLADCQQLRASLITVHVRWGDKWKEMRLQPIRAYVEAARDLAVNYSIARPVVFLTTEDSRAYHAMRQLLTTSPEYMHWTLFTYAPAIANYGQRGQGHTHPAAQSPMADASHSAGGLGSASLISLLVAMEAQYYVLTTGSNWSRVINELRQVVRDRGCGNCTHYTDLLHGEVR